MYKNYSKFIWILDIQFDTKDEQDLNTSSRHRQRLSRHSLICTCTTWKNFVNLEQTFRSQGSSCLFQWFSRSLQHFHSALHVRRWPWPWCLTYFHEVRIGDFGGHGIIVIEWATSSCFVILRMCPWALSYWNIQPCLSPNISAANGRKTSFRNSQ